MLWISWQEISEDLESIFEEWFVPEGGLVAEFVSLQFLVLEHKLELTGLMFRINNFIFWQNLIIIETIN